MKVLFMPKDMNYNMLPVINTSPMESYGYIHPPKN